MGSISTIYNGIRTKLAGRALMDVALSDRSTNGVQNKVVKAKFDDVDEDITQINNDLSNKVTKQTLNTIYYGTPISSSDAVNRTFYRLPFPNGIKPTSLGYMDAQSPGHITYTIANATIQNRYILIELSSAAISSEALYIICECNYT